MIKFILLCYLPFGNAGELKILCCQGFEVKYHDFTLDALNLKPSDVCNVGVTSYPKRGNNIEKRFFIGVVRKAFNQHASFNFAYIGICYYHRLKET